MYLGKLVEIADKEELFENPQYPCTRALLEPIPVSDPRDSGTRGLLKGDVPGPLKPPSGCRFRTRYSQLISPEGYHGDSEPIEYQITREEWKQLRVFIRAISCQTLEECGRDALESEFFENHFTQGAAGEFVEEALLLAGGGKPHEAERPLDRRFIQQSTCAREEPAYEVEPKYGTSPHLAACHLHQKNVSADSE